MYVVTLKEGWRATVFQNTNEEAADLQSGDKVEITSRIFSIYEGYVELFWIGSEELGWYDDRQKCIDTYLTDYKLAVETGKKYGINVILGCEIRFSENLNDYLLFGIDENF